MKHGVWSVHSEAASRPMHIPLSNQAISKDPSAHLAPAVGFSLIELLITLAIILLLTGLYWNSNSGSRQRALQNSCQNNLTKIYVGMTLFGNDNAGRFPNVTNALTSEQALDLLVPVYCSDTSVFICPGSKDQVLPGVQSLTKGKISYAYYMGRGTANVQRALASDAQVDTQSKAAGEPVFSSDGKPPGNNHGKFGGNLLFCDGHVELSPPRAVSTLGLGPGETLLNP